MQGARSLEAGFTIKTAECGSVPPEAQRGGAERPLQERQQSAQVSQLRICLMWILCAEQH